MTNKNKTFWKEFLSSGMWLKHPRTHEPDAILTLTCLAVLICSFRFFFDGMTIQLFGHSFAFSHMEALSFGSFLTPILGAHGFLDSRENLRTAETIKKQVIDETITKE